MPDYQMPYSTEEYETANDQILSKRRQSTAEWKPADVRKGDAV